MKLPRDDLADPAWEGLTGGYRIPYDPRPALRALETGNLEAAWEELWNELHHQGDIGTAAYAVVPHLVRIYKVRGVSDSNIYAMIAIIEECRLSRSNPPLPDEFAPAYYAARQRLVELGAAELCGATDETLVCSIISAIAFAKGQHHLGTFALHFPEDDRHEIISLYEKRRS